MRDTHFWGALALTPEEKVNVEDPVEMERLADALPIERTATVRASTDVANRASMRALEKLGLPFERRTTVQGLDTLFYSLRREDWAGGV